MLRNLFADDDKPKSIASQVGGINVIRKAMRKNKESRFQEEARNVMQILVTYQSDNANSLNVSKKNSLSSAMTK